MITTQDKADDLADVVTPTTNLWIGASDEAGLGNFAWVTDPPTPIDVIFADTKWASLPTQQPDSVFGVSGIALQPDFTWNDLNKFTVLSGYVLELPATNPLNPFSLGDTRYRDGELWVDSDNDGLLGVTEIVYGTDPRTADTDRDGLQ